MKSSLITKLAFAALIILAAGQIPNYMTATPAVATPSVTPAPDAAVSMDPFIGEVVMFAGNFAPRGWAFCHGQLLPISGNEALFSIIGTIYGGDGRTTFALPDLRSRVPVGAGSGPGLSSVREGVRGGQERATLRGETITILPTGPAAGRTRTATRTGTPQRDTGGSQSGGGTTTTPAPPQTFTIAPPQDVTVQQPFLGINYIIAIQGVFPSRS